jgi:hypothetical protein
VQTAKGQVSQADKLKRARLAAVQALQKTQATAAQPSSPVGTGSAAAEERSAPALRPATASRPGAPQAQASSSDDDLEFAQPKAVQPKLEKKQAQLPRSQARQHESSDAKVIAARVQDKLARATAASAHAQPAQAQEQASKVAAAPQNKSAPMNHPVHCVNCITSDALAMSVCTRRTGSPTLVHFEFGAC